MNVLFYLIPKKDVYFLESDCTIRQALEKMEYHHYSSIPVLNKNGEYVSSLSDGDLLWYIKNHGLSLKDVECRNDFVSTWFHEQYTESCLKKFESEHQQELVDMKKNIQKAKDLIKQRVACEQKEG